MIDYIKENHLSIIIALLLIFAVFGGGKEALDLGASSDTTVSNKWTFSGAHVVSGAVTNTSTYTLGSAGTSIKRINVGTCTVHSVTNVFLASSTQEVSCQGGASALTALTGVAVNDIVHLQFSTTSPTINGGLRIIGASASTTQGYIQTLLRQSLVRQVQVIVHLGLLLPQVT